jgi:hypothetical protein
MATSSSSYNPPHECVDRRLSPDADVSSPCSSSKFGVQQVSDGHHLPNQGIMMVDQRDPYPQGFSSFPEEHNGPPRPSSDWEIRRSFAFDEWDDRHDDDAIMIVTRIDDDAEADAATPWTNDGEDPVTTLLWSSTSKYDIPVMSLPTYHPRLYPFQTNGRAKVTPLIITTTPTTAGLSEDASFQSSRSSKHSRDVGLGLGRFITGSQCCESIPRQSTATSTHQTRKRRTVGGVPFWGYSFSSAIEGDSRHPDPAIECEWNERRPAGAPLGARDGASFHEDDDQSSSSSAASSIPPIPEFIFIQKKAEQI